MRKILIADDHPVIRKGLMYIIKTKLVSPDILEAENGQDAFDLMVQEKPDIAIIDVDMPLMNGTELCRRAIKMGLNTKLIILTMHKDQNIFDEVMHIGVSGFIIKDNAIEEVVSCIQEVTKGNIFVSQAIQSFKKITNIDNKDFTIRELLLTLTYTETKVLQLIAKGKSSEEIAQLNFVSVRTIDTHRANICKKLKVKGNNALLVFVAAHKELIM